VDSDADDGLVGGRSDGGVAAALHEVADAFADDLPLELGE
jgi:hypothetical protein